MTREFIEKWVLNDRTGSVNREIDEIRSIYPATPASGSYYWGASQVFTCLLSVPSGKTFILRQLYVYSKTDPNEVVFYNGPSVIATVLPLAVAQSQGNFINGLNLPFVGSAGVSGGVYASNLDSNLFIRVQGILITSE